MSRSLVVYRGPSVYDGSPVRAVLVLKSKNAKTGDMAQLYILRDDMLPHEAQACGLDVSVCGTCPLRSKASGGSGGCYVVTIQGPRSTWLATNGKPVAGAGAIAGALRGKSLRLGAYGDPAALPSHVSLWLASIAGGRVTGYTHGWLRPDAQPLARYVMASCESNAGATLAQSKGWRTFRARAPGAAIQGGEIECPSERVECASCLLCRGASLRARNITIPVHGGPAKLAGALAVVQGVA